MTQNGSRQPRGNVLLALVGLFIVPGFFLADTLVAVARGWSFDARGNYGNLVTFACLAAMLLTLIVFLLLVSIGPPRRALRNNSWGIVVFSISVIVGWFVSEGLLMVIHPQPPFHLRAAGTKYILQPDPFTMTNVSGEAVTTINSLGLRGSEPPPRNDAFRILCVGGSTTECYYLDDTETWTTLLAGRLGEDATVDVWAAAAAISEYAAPHHLRFLEKSPLVDEVDCVVMMVGVNDYLRLLLGFDTGAATPPLWSRSGLFALAKENWVVSRGADNRTRGFVVDLTGEELDLHRLGMRIEEPEVPLDFTAAVEQYGRWIEEICDAAKQRDVRLVLVTQPALWDDFLSEQGNRRLNIARVHPLVREWEYLKAANLAETMDRYNEKLVEVAEKTETELYDAAFDMSGVVKYFYDDYHFNESGCSKFAELLADWFVEHPGNLEMKPEKLGASAPDDVEPSEGPTSDAE